jgi:uncharacterized caspase-like protein
MNRILSTIISLVSGSLVFWGCTTGNCEKSSVRDYNTQVVVVGMENSRVAGACPGAGYDANRMYALLKNYTDNAVLFRDVNATKANVEQALKEAIEKANNGLVILYYSGHGGSDPLPNTGIEEDDGKDEYLCLWDKPMLDNEIWNIITKSKGRVLIIADCCHSQTMFRNGGIKINPPLAWDHTLSEKTNFSMLCWSGCPDNTYSYGSAAGGQFTNALLRHFDTRKTYEYLWNEIKKDSRLRAYENPQSTAIGNGFDGKLIFR